MSGGGEMYALDFVQQTLLLAMLALPLPGGAVLVWLAVREGW